MKANQLVWALLLAGMTAVKLPAQTLQTLVSFNGTNGANPYAALTIGSDGNFYGTTIYGGITNASYPSGMGTVFKVTTNGALTTLVSFANTNGAYPETSLTPGDDGNFYGTTANGGITNSTNPNGFGTLFKVTTNGELTTLVFFNAITYPNGLTLGNDGSFYGTTSEGGITNTTNPNCFGTVFKVTTNGELTTLVSFANTNGAQPVAALTLGNDGNFYGTTANGGITNTTNPYGIFGTVFKVTTNGTLTTLVSFNGTNGASPFGSLTLGKNGNFYGTTTSGLYVSGLGFGTVFCITTNGILTTLVSFNGSNGEGPEAALMLGSDGNYYSTTEYGGNTNLNDGFGYGTLFKVTTNGVLSTLISFDGNNGEQMTAGLTPGNDGNFYGVTAGGGSYGNGTVFRLSLTPIIPPTLTMQFWAGYPLLSMYGTLGDTYTVEYTTNLSAPNWTPMLIVPNLSISPFQMIDPVGIGQPARFYRAVQSSEFTGQHN